MAGVMMLLSACGKTEEATKPAAAVPAAAAKAALKPVAEAKVDATIHDALSSSASTPVAAGDADLERQAEDILARYPGKNAVELLNVPEVNEKLRTALTRLGQDKALQQRIASTVDLAAQIKGIDGPPGSARLDLDIKGYDDARTSRMLQAVLSEDPKRVVGFLVGEIGEATPEISYGGAERASNGVAIKPPEPPPPPK